MKRKIASIFNYETLKVFFTTIYIYYCDDNVIHFKNEHTNKARAMRALAFSAVVKTAEEVTPPPIS